MPGGAVMTGEGIDSQSSFLGVLMALFAAFGGFLFGYDTGIISGVKEMPSWLHVFAGCDWNQAFAGKCKMSTSNESLIVSILSAGTFVGALSGAWTADFIGRRMGLIFTMGIFSVGVAMQMVPQFGVFVAGRLVAGYGVGLVSTLVPLYQSECAPKKIRGFIVGAYQWAITIGLLVASIINNFTKDFSNNWAWWLPIVLQFAWAAILAGGMFILPESPRFLIRKGRFEQARKSMKRLVGGSASDSQVQHELEVIQAALDAETKLGKVGYIECFKMGPSKILLRTMTGLGIQALQQLSGINFIFYYGTTFFKASGFANPFIITIITNVVNVGMTVPGILLIDRLGRRSMLLFGAAGMCICQFLVAIVGTTQGAVYTDAVTGNQVIANPTAQKVLIAFVCGYIALFAAIWGPIPWVVCGEIFPLSVRAKGISMSAGSNWLWNFGIGYATPYLVDQSTPDHKTAGLGVKVFFIWGAACVGCFVFTFFMVPETKGLSLEQVDILYRESNIRQSNAFRRRILEEGATFSTGTAGAYKITSRKAEVYEEDDDYKY